MNITATAPGKVMLTGAYVVLQRPNPALVVTMSARMRIQVRTATGVSGISVECPQIHAKGHYSVGRADSGTRVELVEGSTVGSMAEAAIALVVAAAMKHDADGTRSKVEDGMSVTVQGDEAFYASAVGKTGLGSSAAVVTALVAGVAKALDWHGSVANAAQLAHSAAQGKVGSGFDVSAAVHGSQRYVRFPPEHLHTDSIVSSTGKVCVKDEALRLIEAALGEEFTPWSLPRGWTVVLGQVSGGSSTVSMVKLVEAWRRSSPKMAANLWTDLIAANQEVESAILSGDAGRSAAAFLHARTLLREVGVQSGAPIEPEQLKPTLDATAGLDGVIHAGVPGAGGHDAVCAVLSNPESRPRVEELWRSCGIMPLPCSTEAEGVTVTISSLS